MFLSYVKKYYIYIIIVVVSIIALSYSRFSEPELTQTFEPSIVTNEQESKTTFIYIDIKGSVLNPGVYKVEEGTRLFQAIYLAGGLNHEADVDAINLSTLLIDEGVFYIPTIDEEFPILGIITEIDEEDPDEDTYINLNTGTVSDFETLPGIGPKTAQAIIDYREENGDFVDLVDIMDVPGIGESTYNEIKNYIII